MKLTKEEKVAVLRLRTNADFKAFYEALQRYDMECTDIAIFIADEDKANSARGMARAVRTILASITEAFKGK